jgi:hypothetical protein
MTTRHALRPTIARTVLLTVQILASLGCSDKVTDLEDALAKPVLVFNGSTVVSAGGGDVHVYGLSLGNWSAYSAELFTPRPDLPPCGLNASASRTWLEIYDGSGTRLYGYCGTTNPAELQSFALGVPVAGSQPSSVYVELWDRVRDVRTRSDEVEVR